LNNEDAFLSREVEGTGPMKLQQPANPLARC